MNSQTLVYEKYTFIVYPELHFMEYIVKEGVTIDASDAKEAKKIITDRWPDIKFYVLAQGAKFFTLTREARALSATRSFSSNTRAIAFFTTNASLLLLGKMYIKTDKPHVPTKFFKDKNEARHWLEGQMKKNSDNQTEARS
jgi:hypothetical protein